MASSIISNAFGDVSLYEILGVASTASLDEIKRGYRKKALIYHPDKGGNEEKFKALCVVHTILASEEARQLYDETGEIDGDGDADADGVGSKSFDDWYQYFRSLFPKLDVSAIDEFSEKYKGSDEEVQDILTAYSKHEGSVQGILDTVMLLEQGEEGRIVAVVDTAIAAGEVISYPRYATFRTRYLASHPFSSSSSSSSKSGGKTQKSEKPMKIKTKPAADGALSLEAMILARKQNTDALYDSLLNKYTTKNDKHTDGRSGKVGKGKGKAPVPFEDIPDDVFNKLREKVTKPPESSSSSDRHKKQKKN